jgi:ADP-heptose:LPS heptosyltransferase
VRDLRRRKYDLVFDLQGLFRSGFLSRVSGAPLRYGEAGAREGAGLGHNRRFRCDAEHTVDRMLQVVAGAGVPIVRDMRLYVGESDRRWAGEQLAARGWAADRCLVLAPTARWASKRWPAESFIALARRAGDLALQGVVLLGGPNEQPQTRPIAAALGETCLDLTGRTSVGRMMAVIAAAGLVVANDSAALHIAVGLGRRCVGVFGPTDPRKVGPYRHEACVVRAEVQPGIHYRDSDDASIMASIGVQAVFERAARMLAAPPPELVHA